MSYHLLSEPIRKYIRNKGWEELRPIQHAAIERILTTESNYILASRTASGKTEAAFLPILSKVDFNEKGVQVLYISPLIALINDQFFRIEELCKDLEIPVTKWHGEANKTLKNKLLKKPDGIVLITPESIEAMFVNKPYQVKQLFSNLKFVVIDEIHSFIGTDRGTQLKSLLARIQQLNQNPFRIIGLSATIGDYQEAKNFTGDSQNTKVLLDKKAKDITAVFRFFESEKNELPLALLKDLYLKVKDNKVLIFPNSRGKAEEVSVKLKKISDKVKGHGNYFSHHSSVNRETREYIEYFAKNNQKHNFAIACTSTLELGIDIGTVDKVVQIDATNSIASLIQRVGRSGRKDGESSNLFLYATDTWSLLQSLACWLLYQEGFIEPPEKKEKPYSILVFQILSITKSKGGILIVDLIQEMKENFAFSHIEENEIIEIIKYLLEIDFLEQLNKEVIIGIEGEYIVNSRDFYSVFEREETYKVIHSGITIGQIPFSPQITEDENILLSARIWKIKGIDHQSQKIEVIPAKDGKKPVFAGSEMLIHEKIRQKMLEIIYSFSADVETNYDFLDIESKTELEILQKEFSIFKITDTEKQRPLLIKENYLQLFTFTSTKINRTLLFLFSVAGIKTTLDEKNSCIDISATTNEVVKVWKSLIIPLQNDTKLNSILTSFLASNPKILRSSKWSMYLPTVYQVELVKDTYFDIEGTTEFLNVVELKVNQK